MRSSMSRLGLATLLVVPSALTGQLLAGPAHARAATAPVIRTIAGRGADYLGWGTPAAGIGLNGNEGVATGASGDIYVSSTFDGIVGGIAAPSTWGSQQLGYLAPFGSLSWGLSSFSAITSPATIVKTKTSQGLSAVHWTESSVPANTWIQASPGPGLIAGSSYTAAVTVQGSGQVFLDFFNGAADIDSPAVTLSAAPQTLTVTTTAASGRAPQFQVRTPAAESSVDVLAYAGSITGTAVTGSTRVIAGDTIFGYKGDGGQGPAAEVDYPGGLAADPAGDVYIADTGNDVVRRVSPSGTITTVAGDGKAGYRGDGGAATAAELDYPQSVAVDSAGDLYIADTYNNVIRKVSPSGTITTVAGNGKAGYTDGGGHATAAELCLPEGVAADSGGSVYIADTCNNVIREVTGSGVIATVAGNGTAGYAGDGGTGTAAELDAPFGVTVDAAGDLFVADTANEVIREVTASGTISTVAGNGHSGYSGDGGPATSAALQTPFDVAFDSAAGDLYIVDASGAVRQVTGFPGAAT